MTTTPAIIAHLESLSNDAHRAGMVRFGIETRRAFGIAIPTLRNIAKETKTACKAYKISLHELACELWETGFHEARIVAILLEHPSTMSAEQAESWVYDLDSWDVCDQLSGNLLWKLPERDELLECWCAAEPEFVRRAGIVLIAHIAVHDKKLPDERIIAYFPLLEQYAYDERNFVKKAVNWALRQIGKRNPALRDEAIACAERINAQDSASARWIAKDALRELQGYEFRSRKVSRKGFS